MGIVEGAGLWDGAAGRERKLLVVEHRGEDCFHWSNPGSRAKLVCL